MNRWWFAIVEGFRHRARLRAFLKNQNLQIHDITEITTQRLDAANVAILVLDFDGVLAGHDAKEPLPKAHAWLKALSLQIGEQRIALLTNKPKPQRLRYFSEQFPLIHVVRGERKKPFPDGLKEIIRYKNVPPHRVLLVDDRLLTGMLATCLAHCQGWYFRPPCRQFWHAPIRESFFSLLRTVERFVFQF